MAVDAGGAVTSGNVTGLLTKLASGADFKPWYAIEGIVLNTVAVFSALGTASTSDDQVLLQSALAGADTFNLSSQADAASGFGGNDMLNGMGVCDQATGAMDCDSDGSGFGTQPQFAQFDAGTKIVLGDLFII